MSLQPHICLQEHIADVWPSVSHFLEAALVHGHGEITAEQLKERAQNGQVFIMAARAESGQICGALAIEFLDFPNYRVGHVIAAGGRGFVQSSEGLAIVKEWLKQKGCSFIQWYCNEAGARLWKRIGMKACYQVMRGEL